jgi:hypothetical protein
VARRAGLLLAVVAAVAALGGCGRGLSGAKAQEALARIDAAAAARFEEAMRSYDASRQSLVESGGFQPASLTSREAAEARLAKAVELARQNGELDALIASHVDTVEKEVAAAGVAEEPASAYVQRLRGNFPVETLREQRSLESELYAEGRTMLELLRDEKWSLDYASRQTFAETWAQERFDGLVLKMAEIAARYEEFQTRAGASAR